jgi:hypothetical protein|tara:strand:+ start:77 stop:349 length:273 start_codon:yes stop_codon:yes gene_type:complete
MGDGFAMELCGNKAAWQIVPDGVTSIDLEIVGRVIQEAGYSVGIQTRLCWTFSGPCDLTLYPSGKLLVKTENKDLAAEVAQQHVTVWSQV